MISPFSSILWKPRDPWGGASTTSRCPFCAARCKAVVEHLSLASSNGGELIATSEEEQIYFRFKMLLKTFQVSKFCLKTHWKEAI